MRCSYSARQLVTIRDFAKEKMVVHSGPFGVGKTRCLVTAFGIYCAKLQEMGTTGLTFVLLGKTQQAVKRNMCNVLSQLFGSDFKYYKGNSSGHDQDCILFGQYLYTIGLNDSSSREKFQGLTEIHGVLHDEATLCSQDSFDYIHGRLRGEVNIEGEQEDKDGIYVEVDENQLQIKQDNIKIPEGTTLMWYIASCNPDSPNFWLKQYIDRGIIKEVHWTMKDAIWKGAKEYYKKLMLQYRGNKAFFARYILGRWTAASRMVYPMFNPKLHIINAEDSEIELMKFKRNFISIDYGSDHPTSILLISLNWQGVYVVSHEVKLQNTAPSDIVQKVAELIDFLESCDTYCDDVYVDPSAKALKDELNKRGISHTNALNNHEDGIGFIRTLLATNRLFILDNCENLINEMYTYSFKESNEKNGQDEVVKIEDDFVDSLRYGCYTDSVLRR